MPDEIVFIVEDEEPTRAHYQRVVEELGYRVRGTGDPDEYLDWIEDLEGPVTVLMDLGLGEPRMRIEDEEGVGLSRLTKETCPDAVVILLTGMDAGSIAQPEARADDVLIKPVSSGQLKAALTFTRQRHVEMAAEARQRAEEVAGLRELLAEHHEDLVRLRRAHEPRHERPVGSRRVATAVLGVLNQAFYSIELADPAADDLVDAWLTSQDDFYFVIRDLSELDNDAFTGRRRAIAGCGGTWEIRTGRGQAWRAYYTPAVGSKRTTVLRITRKTEQKRTIDWLQRGGYCR